MIQKKKFRLITAGLLALCAMIFAGAVTQPAFADAQSCTKEGKVPLAIKINGQDCVAKDQVLVMWLKAIIQFLATGIGLAVVGGILTGGIMYMTARDNAKQTQQAIYIITNAIIGLILFILMFSIINFLIPGGILT